MKKLVLVSLLLLSAHLYGQTNSEKCGYSRVKAALVARNPDFDQQLDQYLRNRATLQSLPNARTTGTVTLSVTVPVIFHILLDTTQLNLIKDTIGIAERVTTQIVLLNQDYDRGNADSTLIPAPFKPLYGNVNIKFALAHTTPDGKPSSGWELTVIPQNGFDANTNDPCGAAKHTAMGGADAWDVSRYINVWVINFLDGTQKSQILGLTVPPSFTADTINGFPVNEMGVLLSYAAFGQRTSATEYFYPNIDGGRTLTHEMGHYFGLFHPWGDDGGLCPNEPGGKDDGIADTPPEGGPNYGCPTFPVYDLCSYTGTNGIMFNNYMDYTDDACMNMFTHDQILVMEQEIQPGGGSHELTIHPELLQYPGGYIPPVADNSFIITPNPSPGPLYISFNTTPVGFSHVIVRNTLGQTILDVNTTGVQTSYFPIDLTELSPGTYYITCYFAKGTQTRKIVLL